MGRSIVRDKGLGTKILTLKASGLSNVRIAEIMGSEYGVRMSYNAVKRFLDSEKSVKSALIKKQGEVAKKDLEKYFDVVDQLTRLNGEMWEHFMFLKKASPGNPMIVKTANHILQQLQVASKLLGYVDESKQTFNINILDVSTKINQVLVEKKRKGLLYCKDCRSRNIAYE